MSNCVRGRHCIECVIPRILILALFFFLEQFALIHNFFSLIRTIDVVRSHQIMDCLLVAKINRLLARKQWENWLLLNNVNEWYIKLLVYLSVVDFLIGNAYQNLTGVHFDEGRCGQWWLCYFLTPGNRILILRFLFFRMKNWSLISSQA